MADVNEPADAAVAAQLQRGERACDPPCPGDLSAGQMAQLASLGRNRLVAGGTSGKSSGSP